MEDKYCKRVKEGWATLILYKGCYEEATCSDIHCSSLGSEHDTVKGIDGIERRFCIIKGKNPKLFENQLSP